MKTFLLLGYLSTFGTDAASTHAALKAGGQEILMTQSAVVNGALLGGQAAGSGLMLYKLSKEHPKLAFVIGVSVASLHAWASLHNLRAAEQMRGGR